MRIRMAPRSTPTRICATAGIQLKAANTAGMANVDSLNDMKDSLSR
jgi:hypothetical protein